MLAWNFGFRMWRLTRAPGVLFLRPAEYSAVMCGAFRRSWDMWQWLCFSMICCCALGPWSRTGVICQSCWFLDLVVLYCCAGMECHRPMGWLHMCEMDMGHFANLNLSVAVVRCWYSGCVVLDRTSRRSDIWLFTNSNGSRAGSECACLVPVCGRLE